MNGEEITGGVYEKELEKTYQEGLTDTSYFVLKTKYQTDKTELEN